MQLISKANQADAFFALCLPLHSALFLWMPFVDL